MTTTGIAVDGVFSDLDTHVLSPLSAGLAELLRAYDYAAAARRDVWEFAVEIAELRALGLTTSDLRWLVTKGVLLHGDETTVYGAPLRTFRRVQGLTFLKSTAFVFTAEGAEAVRRLLSRQLRTLSTYVHGELRPKSAPTAHARAEASTRAQLPDGIRPVWESRRRELRVGDILVKRFRVPANNQELVLAAFQEENWQDFIDDPLPGKAGVVRKLRLQNVIHRLNGNQAVTLLRFYSNGNANGVGWKLVEFNCNATEMRLTAD